MEFSLISDRGANRKRSEIIKIQSISYDTIQSHASSPSKMANKGF
jgi:hypothetical protein